MILTLPDGKSVVVNSDLGKLWLQIFANGGSLGIELSGEDAFAVAAALIAGVRKQRRAAQQP